MSGQWQNRSGNEYVPVFNPNDDKPNVNLNYLDNDFNPNYVWLFSRQFLC